MTIEALRAQAARQESHMQSTVRHHDCPALAVCAALGTARPTCVAEGPLSRSTEKCMAGIILMLSRGITPRPPAD